MNNILKVYCDACGELINENEENSCVVYKPIQGETLIFCDSDHFNEFIKEFLQDAYIGYDGSIIED